MSRNALSVGGDQQLADLMGRVMSQRLDRDHPLWEYWVAEGLPEGRWAVISKVHHCMVDGVSGTDLYRVIFDLSAEPRRSRSPPSMSVTVPPSHARPARISPLRGRGRPRKSGAPLGGRGDPGGADARGGAGTP